MLAQWSHPSPAQIEEAEALAQSLGVAVQWSDDGTLLTVEASDLEPPPTNGEASRALLVQLAAQAGLSAEQVDGLIDAAATL